MAKLTELFVELKLSKEHFSSNLRQAAAEVSNFQNAISKVGTAATIVGGVLTGVFTKLTYDFIRYGSEIDRLNKITGISVDIIQKLGYAAQQEHTSIEGLALGLRHLSRTSQEAIQGSKEYIEVYKAIGIDFTDAATRALSLEEILYRVIDAFAKLPEGAEKTAIAIKIFGRSGSELIPFLSLGQEEIRRLGDEFVRTGKILSEDAVRQAKQFSDQLFELRSQISGLTFDIVKNVLPAIRDLVGVLQDSLRLYQKIPQEIRKVVSEFAIFGGLIVVITAGIAKLASLVKGLFGAVSTLVSFIASRLNVFAAFGFAISGIAVAISEAVKSSKDVKQLTDDFKNWGKTKTDLKSLQEELSRINEVLKEYPEAVGLQKRRQFLQEEIQNLLSISEAYSDAAIGVIKPIEVIADKTDEAKKQVKSLSDIFNEQREKLIDVNNVLKQTADLLGVELTAGLMRAGDSFVKFVGVYEGIEKQQRQYIEDQKLIADYFNRILPQGISLTASDMEELNNAFARMGYDWVEGFGPVKQTFDELQETIELLSWRIDDASQVTEKLSEIFDISALKTSEITDESLALVGAYNVLRDEQRRMTEETMFLNGVLALLQSNMQLSDETMRKFYETLQKKGIQQVEIANEIRDVNAELEKLTDKSKQTDKSLRSMMSSLSEEQKAALSVMEQFSDAIIDAMVYGKDMGEELTAIFRRLVAQIIQAIVQAMILKAISGGTIGFGEALMGALGGFDNPKNDMRVMLAEYYSAINSMQTTIYRWTQDFARYQNLAHKNVVREETQPAFQVVVQAPLPGAYVQSIKRLPHGEIDMFHEKITKSIDRRRKLL